MFTIVSLFFVVVTEPAKTHVFGEDQALPPNVIVPANLKEWKIYLRFAGGTPAENRRLGWHEVSIHRSGEMDVIHKIGGEESPKTWQKESVKVGPKDLAELYEHSRNAINDFRLRDVEAAQIWHDGHKVSLSIATDQRSASVHFADMRDYADAGEDVKTIILIINRHLASVKKIRIADDSTK